MSDFFCKLFTPWNAAPLFDSEAKFHAFIILFAIAAVCLLVSYALDTRIGNYIAVGVLVLAIGVTLLYARNEKALPEGMRDK